MMYDMCQRMGGNMWILGILIVALVIVLIVLTAKSGAKTQNTGQEESGESPIDILKKRYAEGEIDDEEYEKKRKRLEE